jgi:hypothetical protein
VAKIRLIPGMSLQVFELPTGEVEMIAHVYAKESKVRFSPSDTGENILKSLLTAGKLPGEPAEWLYVGGELVIDGYRVLTVESFDLVSNPPAVWLDVYDNPIAVLPD